MQKHDSASVWSARGGDIHESHAEALTANLKRHELDGIGIGPALEPDPKRVYIGWAGDSCSLGLGAGRGDDLRRHGERD